MNDVYQKNRSLSKTLLIGVLGISSCATAIFTLVSLMNDYVAEMDGIKQTVIGVERSSQRALANAMFVVDEDTINAQVKGIQSLPFMKSVEIYEPDTEEPVVALSKDGEKQFSQRFSISRILPFLQKHTERYDIPLIYNEDGKDTNVGKLSLIIGKGMIYDKLFLKTLFFAMSQAIKTFLTSFVLLILFKYVVTTRLEKLESLVTGVDIETVQRDQIGALENKEKNRDEISILKVKFKEIVGAIIKYREAAEQKVEDHKNMARESSYMATIGEMSAGIAHEINNPLAIISGCNEINLQVTEDQPEERHYKMIGKNSEKIRKSIDRIKGITYGLLKYSSKGDQLSIRAIEVKGVVKEILSFCHERARSNEITLNRVLPSDWDGKAYGDEVLLGQVLLNILNNAIDCFDAGSSNKVIDVEVKVPNEHQICQISIKNNGPIISEELRDRIMDPFFTTKEVGKGAGLGLSISQGIMTSLHGRLFLQAGKETEFVVEIPAEDLESRYMKTG